MLQMPDQLHRFKSTLFGFVSQSRTEFAERLVMPKRLPHWLIGQESQAIPLFDRVAAWT